MSKKRLTYFLIAYVLGYIMSLLNSGVPNLYYLIPIKLFSVVMMLVFGHLFYFILEEKSQIFAATFRCIKYVVISVVLILAVTLFSDYMLASHHIDITPFIGI
ncbi:hypothetical protein HZI73_24170 [Vallitalea pronyensis]|uniref:Uncharacterized protein n=1 Tax=Vallitalea pronyensis TaxID=1348613 RepID=A0A8J8MNJ4_9FIRM|nr:hypothetical protein [Vallitalea pronyensis]QUI25202.1 hypothetical protein HZI73_24170 [Vallitalea pronyensis]